MNMQKYDINSKYLIFSGIGNPSDFKDILLQNEFIIEREMIYPDHYQYGISDLKKIVDNARRENLKILTTEKDYMKIQEELKDKIDFISVDLVIEDQNKLIEFLK